MKKPMSNIDTVKMILRHMIPNCNFTRENPTYVQDIANELANAGLVMPDLPKPDCEFKENSDASWEMNGTMIVNTFNSSGGSSGSNHCTSTPRVNLNIGDGFVLSPAEAKQFAYILLAAAQYAEKPGG